MINYIFEALRFFSRSKTGLYSKLTTGFIMSVTETISSIILTLFIIIQGKDTFNFLYFDRREILIILVCCFLMFSLLVVYLQFSLSKKLALSHTDFSRRLFIGFSKKSPLNTSKESFIEFFRSDLIKLFDQIYFNLIQFVSKIIISIFSFVIIFSYSARVGIQVFLLLLALHALNDLIIKRKIVENGRKNIQELKSITAHLMEFYNLWMEAVIYRKVDFFSKRLYSSTSKFSIGHFNNYSLGLLPRYFSELVVMFFIFLLSLKSDDAASKQELIIFVIALYRLLPNFLQLNSSMSLIRGSWETLRNIDTIYCSDESNLAPHKIDYTDFRIIDIERVVKSFSNKVIEINRRAMNFVKGNIYQIKGPSGNGKSTLLNIMAGFVIPDNIVYKIDNVRYENDLEPLLGLKIGYVPQFSSFIKGSLHNNIFFEDQINNENVKQLLVDVGLEDLINRDVGDLNQLSGGQIQRISICRALAHSSDLLLMDEPTSSLDLENRVLIKKLLVNLSKDRIIIIVSHDDFFDDVSAKTYEI